MLVDNYNNSRPWLDNKMEPFHVFHGAVIGAGIITANGLFEMGLSEKHKIHHSSGVDNTGHIAYGDIKYKENTLDIGVARGGSIKGKVNFFFGAAANAGTSKLLTRNWHDFESRTSLVKLKNQNFALGATLFFDVRSAGEGLSLRFFYPLPILRQDFNEENAAINNYHINDPALKTSPSNFGFRICIQNGWFN